MLLPERLHVGYQRPHVLAREIQLHGRHLGLRASIPHFVEDHSVGIAGGGTTIREIAGRMAAYIRDVKVDVRQATGEFAEFEIRY